MVWQTFVPDIAGGQLAVFDMAEKRKKERKKKKKKEKKKKKKKKKKKRRRRKKTHQENGILAMASVSQTNDTLSNVQVSHSSRFRSQKQG